MASSRKSSKPRTKATKKSLPPSAPPSNEDSQTVYQVVLWHCVGLYSQLSQMSWEAMIEASAAASEAAQQSPSFMRNAKGVFDQFDIPYFGMRSGPWCAALMSAVLVWSQKIIADNELPDSPLLAAAWEGLQLWAAMNPESAAAKRVLTLTGKNVRSKKKSRR